MFGISGALAVFSAVEERRMLEAQWAELPEAEAQKAREEYKQRLRDDLAHYRAIEVAKAGRPRNWVETLFGGR